MKSIFKKVVDKPCVITDSIDDSSFVFTNSMYDKHKGVTYILHHYDDLNPTSVRYVGDVEIAMTSDDSITSLFSSEHRANLRNQIHSLQKHGSSGFSDEQLSQFPSNVSYERDEAVSIARSNLTEFNKIVKSAVLDAKYKAKSMEPTPQDPTSQEPTPNND